MNPIVKKLSNKFEVEPAKFLDTLKSTAFKQKEGKKISDEQMMALMVVSDQYGLNPFTKEIYAFPDKGGIIPVVGVDGWSRIINQHPKFNGMSFSASDNIITIKGAKPCPEWMECSIYIKDRDHPVSIREYLDEVYRPIGGPWQTHTKRMLRHKTLIQCARVALGFAGIYDPDEAERIREAQKGRSEAPIIIGETEVIPHDKPEIDYIGHKHLIELRNIIANLDITEEEVCSMGRIDSLDKLELKRFEPLKNHLVSMALEKEE